jgi:hypothetical protein
MRRILSILLLLASTVPLVAPALGQTAQEHLMLCCRKGGAHHCMTEETRTDGAPMLRAHCSACPDQAVAGHSETWMAGTDMESATCDAFAPLRIRQVEAGYRISFHRSHQKRGPPAFLRS